jgi:hypothetical protein
MDPWIKKLSVWMFVIGTVIGIVGAYAYYKYMVNSGTWEPGGTASFHLILIGYGCAIMLPLIILSVYLLVRGYTMQLYGLELMEKSSSTLAVVQEELEPMVGDAKEVITQVKEIVNHVDMNKDKVTEVVETLKSMDGTLKNAIGTLTYGAVPKKGDT